MYNVLSYLLQSIVCIILLFGLIKLLNFKPKNMLPIILILASSLFLEVTDFTCRLFKINTNNHLNYLISQLLLFVFIIEIYGKHFFKLYNSIKYLLYSIAVILFVVTACIIGLSKSYSVYSNIIINCILCCFAILYFAKTIKEGRAEKGALSLNICIYFFFRSMHSYRLRLIF